MDWVALGMRAAVVLAFVAAVLATVALDRVRGAGDTTGNGRTNGGRTDPGGGRATAIDDRLLFGVPWGTLTITAFVLAVYLFVQGGYDRWFRPLVIPFRAWSYFEPLGLLTAAFTHAGPGHLIGNLLATLAFATVAEYAVGHYPADGERAPPGSWRANPYVRGFVLFPAGALIAGLATAVFSLGPIIGFSGVVFAFAGFALLYRPVTTVVALSASGALSVAYNALQSPVLVASGRPAYITPWWASIAVQGHALGLLVGLIAAVAFASWRGDRLPRPRRLFACALLFGAEQSMWAIYWYRGGETYVLYRAVGLVAVVVLALLVAALGTYSTYTWRPLGGASIREALGRATPPMAAWVCLLVVTAGLAGAAVPVSLATVGSADLPGEPIEVRDYQVTYAEGVENGMVSAVQVSAFGETTSVNTSGVIVRNPDRGIWTTEVTKGRLAFAGRARIVVGGVGWRETVTVTREGWRAIGGNVTYTVTLRHDGTTRLAYTAEPATAEPRIAGRTMTFVPTNGTFSLAVSRNNRTAVVPVPERNETVSAAGLSFVRRGPDVFAVTNDNATRVRIGSKEMYGGQRSR